MHIRHLTRPHTLISFSLPALFASMTTTAATPPDPRPFSSSNTTTFPTRPYHPRHASFPYTAVDFARDDESPDTDFYASPRFVTHIDDHAISLLRTYYAQTLPRTGRILDFCTSWISHFPPELETLAIATAKGETPRGQREGLEVVGLGINKAELAANPILKERILQDLNTHPSIPASVGMVDAATCVVSIDYLTAPHRVLASLLARTKPGGSVHLVISNRCFPTKAVRRWLRVGEEEKLQMVGDFLWEAGWRRVEIVEVCDGRAEGGSGGGWMGFLGLGGGSCDPLWVVRGTKVEEGGKGS